MIDGIFNFQVILSSDIYGFQMGIFYCYELSWKHKSLSLSLSETKTLGKVKIA